MKRYKIFNGNRGNTVKVITLNIGVSRNTDVCFEYFAGHNPNIGPDEILNIERYRGDIKSVVVNGVRTDIVLDVESKELVDVLLEVEALKFEKIIRGLRFKIQNLEAELNLSIWRKFKRYLNKTLS